MPIAAILRKSARLSYIFLASVLLAAGLPAQAEEYRLAPGDVLRVMVVGAPEMTQDVPIDMDGTAWFPLVGAIAAAGATLGEVRARTADAYATTGLVDPGGAGRALPQFIEPGQVHVTVSAYRPIFVSGAVGTPGEVAFRPGMTLRHIYALAGSAPREAAARTVSAGEVEAAATALARDYAQIWRAKTFLGTATQDDHDRILVNRSPAIEELLAVERSLLDEVRSGLDIRTRQIRDEIARIDGRVAVLERKKETENAGLEMDEEDLANVRDLFERGLVQAGRLAEARRAALVTASRALEVDVALENARGQAATLAADIVRLETDARTRAWTDLADAVARAQDHRATLARLAADAGGAMSADLLGTEPAATIIRDGVALDTSRIPPAFPLLPGDIVEIRLVPLGVAGPGGDG